MHLCRPYIYTLLALGSVFLATMPFYTRVEFLTSVWVPKVMAAAQVLMLWSLLKILERKLGGAPKVLRMVQMIVEALFLVYVMWAVLRLLDHATKAFALPLADASLAAADGFLGLSWVSYFDWIHARPDLHGMLQWAYDAINPATAALFCALILLGQETRAKAFVEAFVICAVLSILFGALFPARAAVDFWIADLSAYTNFASPPGVYHLEALDHMRAPEGPLVVGELFLAGLVTFPSLHTAIGVLIMLASLRSWLWVPAWAYGLVMIASTPVWGGHYFIDLLGGTVMAVAVWALVMKSLTRNAHGVEARRPQGVFSPAE